MHQIVGKCSLCGGAVTVPTVYHSTVPPTPSCQSCGATKKNDLPIVEMERAPRQQLLNETRN
jgi:hypothetical protein